MYGWRIFIATPSGIPGVGSVTPEDFERCHQILEPHGLFERRFRTRSEALGALEWALEVYNSRS